MIINTKNVNYLLSKGLYQEELPDIELKSPESRDKYTNFLDLFIVIE